MNISLTDILERFTDAELEFMIKCGFVDKVKIDEELQRSAENAVTRGDSTLKRNIDILVGRIAIMHSSNLDDSAHSQQPRSQPRSDRTKIQIMRELQRLIKNAMDGLCDREKYLDMIKKNKGMFSKVMNRKLGDALTKCANASICIKEIVDGGGLPEDFPIKSNMTLTKEVLGDANEWFANRD